MSNSTQLTAAQVAKLTAGINGGPATRANFYVDYASDLQSIDPQAAALILSHVFVYSGTDHDYFPPR